MSEFNLDAFLEGIENDKTPERGPSDRLTKLIMSSHDNQGTIMIAPFMNKRNNNFYCVMKDVKEWKMPNSIYGDGKVETWIKLLPKESYDALTPEQEKLYDHVSSLFDQVKDLPGMNYKNIRVRNYTLVYGVVLTQSALDNSDKLDNIDKPVLLIYPSLAVVDALSTSISQQKSAMKGRTDWIPFVLSPNSKGRKGGLSISFHKPDKPGYTCSMSFQMNSEFNTVIDPETEFPESTIEKFNDPVRDFMSWQNDGDHLFNEKLIIELAQSLTFKLRSADASVPAAPQFDNKNGADPVTNPTTATAPTTSEEDDLPF